jgi:hypothetical protein
MRLITGNRILCRQCTLLPMPAEAIERVHSLATHSTQGLDFRDKNEDLDRDVSSQDGDSYDNNDDEGIYYHTITNDGCQSDRIEDADDDSNPSIHPTFPEINQDFNDNHSSQLDHSEIEELQDEELQ